MENRKKEIPALTEMKHFKKNRLAEQVEQNKEPFKIGMYGAGAVA